MARAHVITIRQFKSCRYDGDAEVFQNHQTMGPFCFQLDLSYNLEAITWSSSFLYFVQEYFRKFINQFYLQVGSSIDTSCICYCFGISESPNWASGLLVSTSQEQKSDDRWGNKRDDMFADKL